MKRFRRMVEASGVGPRLEVRLRADRDDEPTGRNPAGRPRWFTVDALLTLLLAHAWDTGQSMYFKYAHKTIKPMAYPVRRAAGLSRTVEVRNDDGTITDVRETVTQRMVEYLFDQIARAMTPLVGGNPTPEAAARPCSGVLPTLYDALAILAEHPNFAESEPDEVILARLAIDLENKDRADLLQHFVDLLTDSSIPADVPDHGMYAMDETAVRAWNRPRGKRPTTKKKEITDEKALEIIAELPDVTSVDPDAHWGYKTPTPADKDRFYFGYSVTAMVAINPIDSPVAEQGPNVCRRLVVRPGASSITEAGITAVDSMIAAGHTVNEVIADRAYSNKLPEHWRQPMRQRGVALTFDLSANDRGCVYDPIYGVWWIDGWPYCHKIPEHLRNIKRPEHFKVPDPAKPDRRIKNHATGPKERKGRHGKQITLADAHRKHNNHARKTRRDKQAAIYRADLQRFNDQIAEQGQYALRRVAGPDPTGKERFEDPAIAGRVICANCTDSKFLIGVNTVLNPPNPNGPNPPKICTVRSITVPGHVQAKTRQLLRWGTPKWINSYARRTQVEGFFGRIKSPGKHGLAHGWTRITGIVRTTLMLTMIIMAANHQAVRKWRKTHPPQPVPEDPDTPTPTTPKATQTPTGDGENPAEPLEPDQSGAA